MGLASQLWGCWQLGSSPLCFRTNIPQPASCELWSFSFPCDCCVLRTGSADVSKISASKSQAWRKPSASRSCKVFLLFRKRNALKLLRNATVVRRDYQLTLCVLPLLVSLCVWPAVVRTREQRLLQTLGLKRYLEKAVGLWRVEDKKVTVSASQLEMKSTFTLFFCLTGISPTLYHICIQTGQAGACFSHVWQQYK